MTTNNWAILIGINQYNFFNNLQFAKADAEAMHSLLKEEDLGFKNIFLFTEDSPPIQKASFPILTQPTFGNLDAFFYEQFKKPPKKLDNL